MRQKCAALRRNLIQEQQHNGGLCVADDRFQFMHTYGYLFIYDLRVVSAHIVRAEIRIGEQ